MKALIVCNGYVLDNSLITEEIKKSDFIIAADGGGNILHNANIIPDFLVGDLDSISNEVLNYFYSKNVMVEKYPVDKDFTDGEIALQKAVDLEVDEISFLGCTGERFDHVLGNLALLYKALNNNIKAKIIDKNNIIYLIDKKCIIEKIEGYKFSLLPYISPINNLSISGARYKLNNYKLEHGSTRTISNEFLDDNIEIDFSSGVMIVVLSKDNALI